MWGGISFLRLPIYILITDSVLKIVKLFLLYLRAFGRNHGDHVAFGAFDVGGYETFLLVGDPDVLLAVERSGHELKEMVRKNTNFSSREVMLTNGVEEMEQKRTLTLNNQTK
uniref:Uncharacterized protein n=1 Tax=Romanomermis culicivorax TaxID=13658 RepID=A0A915KLW3_ROMCU